MSSKSKKIASSLNTLREQILKNRLGFTFFIKTVSPYLLVFLFTLTWNSIVKRGKTRCLQVGMEDAPDDCTPYSGKFWGSGFTTFISIWIYSSGHFTFGSNLLAKYSTPERKNLLLIINFCCFMLSHCLILNGPILEEKVCILFKIYLIVILNAFSFIAISKYTGHPKPFSMMKNYFYFELFTCSIPTITVLCSRLTYPIFLKTGSKNIALFLTSVFNSIYDLAASKLMIYYILAENIYLENVDLMPGAFILTGYLDGLFFGNLLPQDINSFGFWINAIFYYVVNFSVISGLRRKFEAFLERKHPRSPSTLTLIFNGSRFFSIFPMVITVLFIQLNSPYLYGSLMYDYNKFDWLETTDKYDHQKIEDLFSFDKVAVMIAFSIALMVFGYFKRNHYGFVEITLPVYIRNIFFTFKIFTMFTIGFEYSVLVGNVVDRDVIDMMLGPYWRLLQIHD